jgi:DNA-binding response OmpR family regulator
MISEAQPTNAAAAAIRALIVTGLPAGKSSLVAGLCQVGWAVEEVPFDDTLPTVIDGNFFDVVIIDWILPRGTSLETLRQVRAHNAGVRIIMLADEDDVLGRIRGFDSGADDYLVGPFSLVELVARCRALLRRR